MSKADKMFEELGYKKYPYDLNTGVGFHIDYYKDDDFDICIGFFSDKTVTKIDFDNRPFFTMQELKAVNKKCKELGWLE